MGAWARGKKSTVSVDKSAEKLSPRPNFPCSYGASLVCLFFRQIYNPMKTNKRNFNAWENHDKSRAFVTVP
jgi:hypothetical protein